jgi:predicted GNAT family acetyltransferase
MRPEVLAAWRGREVAGLAALHPTVVLDASAEPAALEAFFPYLGGIGSGLVKSTCDVVDPLWEWLRARGRRSLLDRIEVGYALEREAARFVSPPPDAAIRPAAASDLDFLVEAARASLLEEHRPDPSQADPRGFRRWVRSRMSRALVAARRGEPAFVAYADVQCAWGWLLQGVYTLPEERRRGLGAAGVSGLCRRAFAAGTDHVQLAVVEGNVPAERLYQRLGFRPFARLRTLLFA